MLFGLFGNAALMFTLMVLAGYFDRVVEGRRQRDLIVAAWAQQFQRKVMAPPNPNRPSEAARSRQSD